MSTTHASEAAMNMRDIDPAAVPATPSPPPQAAPPSGIWHPSQGQMFDPRRKSPILAAVLSMFPGVGQLYIGYYVRGFVTAATFLLAIATAASLDEPLGPVLGMFAMFVWVFNVIDGGRMAALYNHAAAGSDVLDMPEDFKLPTRGGSLAGGAVLLTFGAIALSNTAFGYSLDWLESWWPLFPLAIGLYLFARGVMDAAGGREPAAVDE